MKNEVLYHFFPRNSKVSSTAIDILTSIFENGLFLTKEILSIPWDDYFSKNNETRKLQVEQYRFCLTSITNRDELIIHSQKFGYIGLEFNIDFITKLGGFPVFYVPSPRYDTMDEDDYRGISLLYRIAEVQEILEYIIKNSVLSSKDIDIENTLGAVKLLANICYPTERKISSNQIASNYYNQREWRVIYGLTSNKVITAKNEFGFAIKTFNNIPIFNYINKIVMVDGEWNTSKISKDDIYKIVSNYKSDIQIEVL